jgi:hypothetical protein
VPGVVDSAEFFVRRHFTSTAGTPKLAHVGFLQELTSTPAIAKGTGGNGGEDFTDNEKSPTSH